MTKSVKVGKVESVKVETHEHPKYPFDQLKKAGDSFYVEGEGVEPQNLRMAYAHWLLRGCVHIKKEGHGYRFVLMKKVGG